MVHDTRPPAGKGGPMFEPAPPARAGTAPFRLAGLIHQAAVRHVRRDHGNATWGLVLNILQTVLFIGAFYLMFALLGLRGTALRGDFLLFIMTGVFLFMTHTKTVAAVVGAEGSASPMMLHGPMTTAVSLSGAALGALHVQLLSMAAILWVYHAAVVPIEIHDPAGALSMVLLAWASGVGVGLLLAALKPWLPNLASTLSTVYGRINMIASGKMFVANATPGHILRWFDWNPLFHCIDQARGFTFLNYNPHYSSVSYPLAVTVVLVFLGLLAEFHTRRHASASWNAGR
jgi:ABC-type polysaccharide/polyol phosphate export permease